MTRDLFGFEACAPVARGEVSLALVWHREGHAAVLLGQTDDAREARWVPKSEVRRGEGRDRDVWTMPAWLARDRGWL